MITTVSRTPLVRLARCACHRGRPSEFNSITFWWRFHVAYSFQACVARGGLRLSNFLLFVGCLTSQQHACVSQGRICSDNFTCCHTEIEVADPTFHLTQSQYTDNRSTSPSTDPISPGRVATGVRPGKIPSQAGFERRIFRSRGGHVNQ